MFVFLSSSSLLKFPDIFLCVFGLFLYIFLDSNMIYIFK